MFQSPADERGRRGAGWWISAGLHVCVLAAVLGQGWLRDVMAASQAEPPPPPAKYSLSILAPPPGKPVRSQALSFSLAPAVEAAPGVAAKIEDGTDIAFDPDEARQLPSVLSENGGLILFVETLDRVHPKGAFRLDGSAAAVPASLEHWVRIRLANPEWWPEIDAICAAGNANGELEAVAAFPPSYRAALGAAVEAHMKEQKSSGKVVGVALRLEAGQPAGVRVRAVRLAENNRIG